MGNQLDALARHALWEAGLDYNHGTGHGVGAFLNVHEGPHGISKARPCSKPLFKGMFVTDGNYCPGHYNHRLLISFLCIEPGYYEDDKFGMRIENVELIKKVHTENQFNNVDYLSMEPVTLVRPDINLFDHNYTTTNRSQYN